jgi:uncharacterized protein (TIGR03437 family)
MVALKVPGTPAPIAVDPTGSDVVVGLSTSAGWELARLAQDGADWTVQLTLPRASLVPALAVAANGDAVVYGGSPGGLTLTRVDRSAGVLFSKANPGARGQVWATGGGLVSGGLALDAAGNAYVTGGSGGLMHPARNSLAPCGTDWLSVYAPDGSLLQSTYLPGGGTAAAIAVSAVGSVVIVGAVDPAFAPTQMGPFPQNYYGVGKSSVGMFHLSPNANAAALPLACVGNALTYSTGAISPGSLVTLFGNGLGPQQGVLMQATLTANFPAHAADVVVTFDGIPAPLVWVQDAQINVVVPWSVAGPTTRVCVTYLGVETNCLSWPVMEASPGVLTSDGTYAVALNQDGTVNSAANPATPDSIVSVFATGLGPLNPAQPDGSLVRFPLPGNALPFSLRVPCVGGFVGPPCPVPPVTYDPAYGGPAPFLVAGTSQINFRAGDASHGLYVSVDTSSVLVSSNLFSIYLAAQ